MIDFVLVENVLVCVVLFQLVISMTFVLVYLGASVVDHVCDVRRNVKYLWR